MLVTDGCEACRSLIPSCLREFTRTVRTFRLEDDFFARLCIDYSTAADKSLNQSLTSEIRSEKDPLRRVAMMRLVPEALSQVHARQRLLSPRFNRHSLFLYGAGGLTTVTVLTLGTRRLLANWDMPKPVRYGLTAFTMFPFWEMGVFFLGRKVSQMWSGHAHYKILPLRDITETEDEDIVEDPAVPAPVPRIAPTLPEPDSDHSDDVSSVTTDPGAHMDEIRNWFQNLPPPPGLGPDDRIPVNTIVGPLESVILETNIESGEDYLARVETRDIPVPRVATPIGPTTQEVQHYSDALENIIRACKGRVEGKAKPFKPSDKVYAGILSVQRALKDHVFTKRRVQQWAADNPCLNELVSKKWSQRTVVNALDMLMATSANQHFVKWAVSIKDEILAAGKEPRMIMSCGGAGQLCALLTVKCFEDLYFDHFERRSIKHRPKMVAMREVAEKMRYGHVYENDGSAWDVTVSPELRHTLEDPILEHIAMLLFSHGNFELITWDMQGADLEDRRKDQLKASFNKHGARACIIVRAFRKSGDRGTSALNNLVNLTLWSAMVLDDPAQVVYKPSARKYRINGQNTDFAFFYEGDDSIVSCGQRLDVDHLTKEWERAGMRPKLFHRKKGDAWTFCGVNGIAGTLAEPVPQLARNIASSAYSVSQGLDTGLARAMTLVGRVENFRDSCPVFAHYFACIARHHLQGCTLKSVPMDRESQMQIYGDYDDSRTVNIEDLLVVDNRTSTKGTDVIQAACGAPLTQELVSAIAGLDTLGPEDTWIFRHMPAEWFHVPA